jgi:hypothetical protein
VKRYRCLVVHHPHGANRFANSACICGSVNVHPPISVEFLPQGAIKGESLPQVGYQEFRQG